MDSILIAGGTGYLGKHLERVLISKGYAVKILTRNPRSNNHVYWNPQTMELDTAACSETNVLVNLCGESIDKHRWTSKRKKELIDSRVELTRRLHVLTRELKNLNYYVSASGITAYGFDDGRDLHSESDAVGSDFLSQLVKEWEQAADMFQSGCRVCKIRIAPVMEEEKGVLAKVSPLVKLNLGAYFGSGKQQMAWVHVSDLMRLFVFAIENRLEGAFNSNAGNCSNKELMDVIAVHYKKRIWLPNIPSVLLKMVLGEQSELVLKGARADNRKVKTKGFLHEIESISRVFYEKKH